MSVRYQIFKKKTDLIFFKRIAMDCDEWKEIELKGKSIEEYIDESEKWHGEWRVWNIGEDKVALSYHVKKAQSNEKPWLGTLLVAAEWRGNGVAKLILDFISKEVYSDSADVLFAACPISQIKWSSFLSKNGFEQYKLEKDEHGESYLIHARPLV
jgi:GNAT superfamily N-acetyltransferase